MLHTHTHTHTMEYTHTQWNTHTHNGIHTHTHTHSTTLKGKPFLWLKSVFSFRVLWNFSNPQAEDATAPFLLLHLLRELTRDQSTCYPKGRRAPCPVHAPPSLATPSRGDRLSVRWGRKGGGQQRSAPERLCLCQWTCVCARTWANSKQPVRKQVLNNIVHG